MPNRARVHVASLEEEKEEEEDEEEEEEEEEEVFWCFFALSIRASHNAQRVDLKC